MTDTGIDPSSWDGRCVHSESTLHQLSPFLGKMKSTMAGELVREFSEPGDDVLDPFCGSGTVPLEASIHGRNSYGIDRNPYSVLLTRGKLHPPKNVKTATELADSYLDKINSDAELSDTAPEWVQDFFHPQTLSETLQLFEFLRENDEWFLLACLLGILHHQRPGFLSYPASNLRPYLRNEKFPRDEYPEKYEYREIRPRLISKIKRAYRRASAKDSRYSREVFQGDSTTVIDKSFDDNSIQSIITSPPYMNKLDYGRDNRLRLYFIGIQDYKELDGSPRSKAAYRSFLDDFLIEALRVLSPDGKLVFVLGESQRSGAAVDTSKVLVDMIKRRKYGLTVTNVIQDKVPIREINSMSSKTETVLALEKE